ncbi:hypothetical protein LTR53_014545 [Teratosphaeriaceae sp. CCFEE 6253]|nr:hypothetical protein LTR53_014545 [Teratosphaeriaceae sp. CCFEE 6253]
MPSHDSLKPATHHHSSTSTTASTPPEDDPPATADPHKPQSIPPWVHINDGHADSTHLRHPEHTVPNSRHYKPPPPHHYKPGRKWDHLRDAEPPLLSAPISTHQERWRGFMHSGPTPLEQQARTRVVDQAWMDEHMPYLDAGWVGDGTEWGEDGGAGGTGKEARGWTGLMYGGKWLISPEMQERTVRLFWRLLLKNPFVPLAFRLSTLAFSGSALAIAATIRVNVNSVNSDNEANNQCATRASTYMALCVGCVAIPYVGHDSLGLRSVPAKVLLLLCDLYFVVFGASNLSLAFDALYDHRWACYNENFALIGDDGNQIIYSVPATCPNNPHICRKQQALSGILVISLLAWLITFSISVMRVVEKLRPD